MSRPDLHVADAYDLLAEHRRLWPELPTFWDATHGYAHPGDMACWLASIGFPVFPLAPNTKIPTKGSNGLNDATCDLKTVIDLFKAAGWTDANVGLRCGVKFDVIDVDAHHGGLDTLSELVGGENATIPCQIVVDTPNGGAHFYYQPTGYGTHTAIAPGIDFKAVGGYVVAACGATRDGRYAWHEENGETFDFDHPFLPLPKCFRDLIECAEAPNVAKDHAQDRRVTRVTERPGTQGQAYVSAALEREELHVANAPVGARHNTICRSAYALARLDQLDAETIKTVLGHAAVGNGRTQKEVDTAVDSAFEKRNR